jgi:hypothetical protein
MFTPNNSRRVGSSNLSYFFTITMTTLGGGHLLQTLCYPHCPVSQMRPSKATIANTRRFASLANTVGLIPFMES